MSRGQAHPQRAPGPGTALDSRAVAKQCQPSPTTLSLIREQGFRNVMEAIGADHRC